MNQRILEQIANNVDEETIRELEQHVDDEQIAELVQQAFTERVVPHLEDVHADAQESPSRERVREHYASLSDEEQQEAFDGAIRDIVVALFMLRMDPPEGARRLKGLLRDPFISEALLLIFENDDHIDPSYSQQMKEYGAEVMEWFGVALMQEAYDRETVAKVAEQFGIDTDATPTGDDTADTEPAD